MAATWSGNHLIGWDCPRQPDGLSPSILVWTNIPFLATLATTTSNHELDFALHIKILMEALVQSATHSNAGVNNLSPVLECQPDADTTSATIFGLTCHLQRSVSKIIIWINPLLGYLCKRQSTSLSGKWDESHQRCQMSCNCTQAELKS